MRLGRQASRVNLALTRLAVMSYVRMTCSRPGAFAQDAADASGDNLCWIGKNILSVSDFIWAPEGMELSSFQEVTTTVTGHRAQVTVNRVKRYYHEKYSYDMSITPDVAHEARRASMWLLCYMFARALFKCQWWGMNPAVSAHWTLYY